jgi:hypothetical protein
MIERFPVKRSIFVWQKWKDNDWEEVTCCFWDCVCGVGDHTGLPGGEVLGYAEP